MTSQPPAKPNTFARTNSRGLIEIVDMSDGRIVCVQATPEDLFQHKWDRLVRFETPAGVVWLEKGLNFDLIEHLQLIPYSKLLADLLCQEVVEGRSLKKAVETLGGGMQYSDVIRWQREVPEFKMALDQARKDRTEAQHDQILEIAKESRPSTHIEALKWSAEKNNPDKFGNKTKVTGDPNAPITFVIDTGIRRDTAPEEKEAARVSENGQETALDELPEIL